MNEINLLYLTTKCQNLETKNKQLQNELEIYKKKVEELQEYKNQYLRISKQFEDLKSYLKNMSQIFGKLSNLNSQTTIEEVIQNPICYVSNHETISNSSGLYLIELGYYEHYRDKLLSPDYVKIPQNIDSLKLKFYKFGKTKTLTQRLSQHIEKFKSIGIDISVKNLKLFCNIPERLITEAENRVFSHLLANNCIFVTKDYKGENYKEIVVLSETQYENLAKVYEKLNV